MNGIKFGPGSIYIGEEKIASIESVEFTSEPEYVDDRWPIIHFDEAREASFTGYLIPARGCGKSMHAAWHMILGIMAELKRLCPNKRVVHLAFHAKKKRTRKKNYRRMLRIVEEQNK